MEKSIAKDLLSIGAVFLRPEQPFTWASGIKSPIYCDNRLTLTAPVVRGHVEAGLAGIVRTKFPGAEVLMGTSTAGIAHAAITATILDLPMGYVRSGSKDHGRGNRIEGKLEKGQKVVVIEDLISTGGSCIEVVNALREAGAEVLGVASIFTYGMKKGLERLKEADVVNYSLSNLDALVEVAAEEGYIEPGDKARLLKFRDNREEKYATFNRSDRPDGCRNRTDRCAGGGHHRQPCQIQRGVQGKEAGDALLRALDPYAPEFHLGHDGAGRQRHRFL